MRLRQRQGLPRSRRGTTPDKAARWNACTAELDELAARHEKQAVPA
ncbi:hypothetical protein QLQ12_32365 [Actinoplanes sp. NEAU-A12]|uniref:Uncharacterized protein n=1 Tax=Actinoplanes sandaracinus TaxID=3045177 RepID=A0ABT6WU87_9ACTN|nr:hypothetical protein [Actinoplanes sandaracinus]MDI6103313.1 hypothetical protein [Actinoplanes sandaracinus]